MRVPWILGALLAVVTIPLVAMLLLNPRPGESPGWERLADMNFPRGEVASTVLGDAIAFAGGFSGLGLTSDRVSIYEVPVNRWDELPRLPEPRHHAGLTALDGGLYLTGGASGALDWEPRADFWHLAPGADGWEALEPMPEGRVSHRAVALDDRLYVVGGQGPSDDVLMWAPDDGWSRGAPIPVSRHHLAVVVLGGEIWALGGRDDDETVLTDVHIYDPEVDAWRTGPSLPQPVSAAVEGVIGSTIHLVGGEDPAVVRGGVIDLHLVLEQGSELWQAAPTPPVAVHGGGGGVVQGRLIVAGGSRRQGYLSPLAWTELTAAFDPEARR